MTARRTTNDNGFLYGRNAKPKGRERLRDLALLEITEGALREAVTKGVPAAAATLAEVELRAARGEPVHLYRHTNTGGFRIERAPLAMEGAR